MILIDDIYIEYDHLYWSYVVCSGECVCGETEAFWHRPGCDNGHFECDSCGTETDAHLSTEAEIVDWYELAAISRTTNQRNNRHERN